MPPPAETSVVLFDGVCNLCNGAVQFILKRDPRGRFRFASLQSAAAARLLPGPGASAGLESVVLIEGGRTYERSTAALRIARGLRWPWPLAGAAMVIPRPLRDWAYDIIAARRYRWFGRRDSCMIPTPDVAHRFLER
jgi:predicted DCC family thiol-disulfide oxidoreductase YuxK